LLTKAVKPGGGKIAPPPQLVHILDNLFKHANRAFNLPMPELPFQRPDSLVDDREDPAKDRSRADNMVGDLLHGPDLHRQVKPVNNMRQYASLVLAAPSASLHDFRPIRENGDLSVSGISFELKSLQRPRPHFKLPGVGRREIMTRRRSSSAATATRDDDLKIARCLGIRASDMRGIDDDDELAQGIIQHAELKLCALACLRWTFPLPPKRLFFQARAKRQGSLAHRLMAFGRFNGQEFGQDLLALRQHASQARR
jgi:hypothetical protein